MKYFGSLSRGERGTGGKKKQKKHKKNSELEPKHYCGIYGLFLITKKSNCRHLSQPADKKKKVTFKNINRLSQNISTSPTCLQSKNGISRHVTWLALAGRYMFMVGRWLQHERWHRKIWLENQDTRGPRERGALFPSSGSTTNRLVL